ncbi:hemin-degrading factor [Roseibium sp.]|uniref:hemin-degrading factor n=1 Tax=Roseibium sp. TaxID=1936156 RepID=UPI003A96B3B9
MTETNSPRYRADQIRNLREQHPNLRERDFARSIGISEAEFTAAYVGQNVRRISTDFDVIFPGLQKVGEVMALTRNESAVHEKIGLFEKFVNGKRAALMLGENIDTRMFRSAWVHGFEVRKTDGGTLRQSLQFFGADGEAVFKVHTRPETDLAAWDELVEALLLDDQQEGLSVKEQEEPTEPRATATAEIVTTLKERWEAMTDPHQFHGMLKDLDLHRLSAFEVIGTRWAWQLDKDAAVSLLRIAASEGLPIMCFVGNKGCIQIHSGPISKIMEKGPWINVMDPTFHLHLRMDQIAEVWAVRKPADIEHVTSVEAYDKDGNQIIQFFGVRKEGSTERSDWRELVEKLPQIQPVSALGAAE